MARGSEFLPRRRSRRRQAQPLVRGVAVLSCSRSFPVELAGRDSQCPRGLRLQRGAGAELCAPPWETSFTRALTN